MSQWLNFEFYASQYVIATESILKAAQGTPFQKQKHAIQLTKKTVAYSGLDFEGMW